MTCDGSAFSVLAVKSATSVNSTVTSRRVPAELSDVPDSISCRTICRGMKLAKLRTTVRIVNTERPSSSISAMTEWSAADRRSGSAGSRRSAGRDFAATAPSAIRARTRTAASRRQRPAPAQTALRRSAMIWAKNSSSGAITRKPDIGRAGSLDADGRPRHRFGPPRPRRTAAPRRRLARTGWPARDPGSLSAPICGRSSPSLRNLLHQSAHLGMADDAIGIVEQECQAGFAEPLLRPACPRTG